MMRFEKEKTNTENASSPKPIEAAVSKIEAALRLAVGPTHLQCLLNASKAAKLRQSTAP